MMSACRIDKADKPEAEVEGDHQLRYQVEDGRKTAFEALDLIYCEYRQLYSEDVVYGSFKVPQLRR